MGSLFVIYIYTFGFFLPCSIIVFFYSKILQSLRNRTHLRRKNSFGMQNQERSNNLVTAMIISFLFIWFPYACSSALQAFGFIPSSLGSYLLIAIPTILCKTSVCLDPIVYFAFN